MHHPGTGGETLEITKDGLELGLGDVFPPETPNDAQQWWPLRAGIQRRGNFLIDNTTQTRGQILVDDGHGPASL